MCVIIDANRASVVFREPPDPDFAPILDWLLQEGGELVFGGRLAAELEGVGKAKRFLRALVVAGRARRVPDAEVEAEEEVVQRTGYCRSDDPHVIALARRSGARTLCTEDRDLFRDFRDLRLVKPKGSIYRNRTHAHLLRHTNSCGRLSRRRR